MKTTVYAISDFSGDTAAKVAKAALNQFPGIQFKVVKVPGVSKTSQLDKVFENAKTGSSAIFYTLVSGKLRDYIAERAASDGIPHFDVFGPALSAIDHISEEKPVLKPGHISHLDPEYFNWVEAVQFAVRHDDGTNTATLDKADIVLIGVSRTGKTPLTIYLAYRGWKVANVPIIYGFPLPEELAGVDTKKIIGLTINAKQLAAIRQRRLSFVSNMLEAQYADPTFIHRELRYGKELMSQLGCHTIDVSGKAVEEIAQEIRLYLQTDS